MDPYPYPLLSATKTSNKLCNIHGSNYFEYGFLSDHTHVIAMIREGVEATSSNYEYFVSDSAYYAKQRSYLPPAGVEILSASRINSYEQQLLEDIQICPQIDGVGHRVLVLWPVCYYMSHRFVDS